MLNQRIEQVRNQFSEHNIDALLVTEPKNIRYLSNFTGTTAILFITETDAFFITDFRYDQQAHQQAKGYNIIIHSNGMFQQVKELIEKYALKRIGFEASHLTVDTFNQLTELFPGELVATQHLIEKIREIKDDSEIAIIQQSADIMDKAYTHILEFIQIGMTELAIANELERFCKDLGASSMSFDTIVASGERSAMPHGVASNKKIQKNELVTIDFGCYYNGYTADMTRTFATGSIDSQLEEIYQIVLDAQLLVNKEAKAGLTGQEIDAIARDYITDHGYGDLFGHSTGHGIGLDIHENPSISKNNPNPVVAGNVITNEPGIYIDGVGGVRIEDDIAIYENSTTILNHSPKELIIL